MSSRRSVFGLRCAPHTIVLSCVCLRICPADPSSPTFRIARFPRSRPRVCLRRRVFQHCISVRVAELVVARRPRTRLCRHVPLHVRAPCRLARICLLRTCRHIMHACLALLRHMSFLVADRRDVEAEFRSPSLCVPRRIFHGIRRPDPRCRTLFRPSRKIDPHTSWMWSMRSEALSQRPLPVLLLTVTATCRMVATCLVCHVSGMVSLFHAPQAPRPMSVVMCLRRSPPC